MKLFPSRRSAALALSLSLGSLVGLGSLATGPAADVRAAEENVIEAILAWEGGAPVPALPGTVELSFSRNKGVDAPDGAGDVRHGAVPLAAAKGGAVEVAVDLTPRSERIWIDTDLDGQVKDERALSWQRSGLKWFASAVVRVPTESGTVRVPLKIWRGAFRSEDEFLYEARAHRWGAAPVGTKLVMVSLEDVDGDLRFTPNSRDRVYVDLNGDGRYDARPGSPERCVPGGTVELGGRRRRIDVAEDGATVRFVSDDSPAHPLLPRAGARVEKPAENFDTLFARFAEERRRPSSARRDTIERIGALGTAESLATLDHTARSDFDTDVRALAVLALGNPAYVETGAAKVAEFARSADSRVAVAAIRALHLMDAPERTAVYADRLQATDTRIVESAARHLAELDTAMARAPLVRAIETREESEFRLAAYRGARRAPQGAPIQACLSAAADDGDALRVLALRDLVESRDSRARKLLHAAARNLHPRDDGGELLPLLARGGDRECVDAIIRIGATRNAAVAQELLARMTDAITAQRLGAALEDGDTQERAFAAEVLGLQGDPRAVGRLLAQLEDEREGFVRAALLIALGDLGETRSITALARATAEEGGGGPRALFTALATPWVRGVPEAVSAFRVGLREDHWRMRELTLQTIGAAGEKGVLREVRDALRDAHRQVRAAAATTLGEVRDRESVRPLVVLLRNESSQRVRDAAGRALFHLTGVNLYDDADLWQSWWSENGDTFVVPAKMPVMPPAAVGGTSAPEPPKFYGIPLDTESVVFVIDQSGSMSAGGGPFLRGGGGNGSKFQTAVKELLTAVKDLEDGALVNVILFETGVRSWRKGMQKLSKSTRKSLRQYLMRMTPDGATNLYDALERALRIEGVETIVLLSDGEPTHGRYTAANQILAAVQGINERRGVVLHCVSIGGGSALLRRLAAQNDGEYVTR